MLSPIPFQNILLYVLVFVFTSYRELLPPGGQDLISVSLVLITVPDADQALMNIF